MSKSILPFVFLALLSCQDYESKDRASFKTIMIKSYGMVETAPDMGTFHIDLSCLDPSIQSSKNCLVEESNELMSRLESFGIPSEDILTTSVNLNRSYSYINNTRVLEGFRSSTTLIITVKNLEQLDEIYTELLENNNLELGGLNYSHTKLDSLHNEGYIDALEKANILSARLLEKLPETNIEILKIGNVEISESLPEHKASREEAEGSMAVNNRSVAINKGTIKIFSTLFVEYRID